MSGQFRDLEEAVGNFRYRLDEVAGSDLRSAIDLWRRERRSERLWSRDASLWTGKDESEWLGWLDIVSQQLARGHEFRAAAEDAAAGGFRQVVVLGMGGSSLCPEVLSRTFPTAAGQPQLFVLDSTVPAQIRALETRLDLEKTLFIVASKSGSTAEPNAFKSYFRDKLGQRGDQFIAITDPGSALEASAGKEGFRKLYHGVPTIGGRYSALSHFGMIPAALMGIDVSSFLARTAKMVEACSASVPPEANPGVLLGLLLGTLAARGRNKVTFVSADPLRPLGGWLEQLIAESTGKSGLGLVPIDGEAPGAPSAYGADRVFVELRCRGQDGGETEEIVRGHPLLSIELESLDDLGQEFFRWEMATAVAGAVMGLNPFDQPDVEASKVATRRLLARYQDEGELPEESPVATVGTWKLFTDEANFRALGGTSDGPTLVRAHLERLEPGDYFAINAYLEMSPENDAELQAIRTLARDRKRVATTLGYGPRFLHSTGQLHKGGPEAAVFLQLTAENASDLPIPGEKASFGLLARFQAEGDLAVLLERPRRALRIHLGPDVKAGLRDLHDLVRQSLEKP